MTNDNNTATNDDDYTAAELLAMSEADFEEAVTEDLQYTLSAESAFQDATVIRRTLTSLLSRLHFANTTMQRQAEDPSCSAERYERTLSFRRHIIAAVDITEHRISWQDGKARQDREARAWRKLLNEVLDELEGTPFDDILDQFQIPFVKTMTLRDWVAVRRTKRADQVAEKEVAA